MDICSYTSGGHKAKLTGCPHTCRLLRPNGIRETRNIPNTCHPNHSLLEILFTIHTIRGVEHGLACTLGLRLGNGSAVAVHDGFIRIS